MNKMYAFVVGAPLAIGAAASAQVLNGGFENNTAGSSQTNLSNAAYGGLVSNSAAFGTAQETDLWDATGYGSITPFGNWMVGMHYRSDGSGTFDAVSLSLASPLVVSQSYTVYWASAVYSTGLGGTIQVGSSSVPNAFGTPIISGTAGSSNSWTLFSYTFTATSPDSYLTFAVTNPGGYAFLDNVAITPTPGAATILGLGGLAAARRRRA